MTDNSEISRIELLAIINSIEPLIKAYEAGELSREEKIYLESVAEVMWPIVQDLISALWEQLEPILVALGTWPPKEET